VSAFGRLSDASREPPCTGRDADRARLGAVGKASSSGASTPRASPIARTPRRGPRRCGRCSRSCPASRPARSRPSSTRATWRRRRAASGTPRRCLGCSAGWRPDARIGDTFSPSRLKSVQQFRFLRGKLGLGQNASGVQFRPSALLQQYVVMPGSSSTRRGLLLGGRLICWFGRCLRFTRAGDDRQAA
jgi:hypothetical protein